MKQKHLLLILTFCSAVCASAAIAPPAWVTDDGVISVTYRFETGETEPVPSVANNLVDTPYLLIDKVTEVSTGWVPPGSAYITRENGGTWELGELGHMDLFLPLVETSGPGLYIDFFIEVIAGQGFPFLPALEIDGDVDYVTEVIDSDLVMDWVQQVWTGQRSLAATNNLSFSLVCSDDSSLIDQVLVHTRVIPEPATGALLLMAGVLIFIQRHWYT